jgi:hypothetical protein
LQAAYPGKQITFDPKGDYSAATVTFQRTETGGVRAEALMPPEELRRRLITLGWSIEEKIGVEQFTPPANRRPDDKATWVATRFTIKTGTDIEEWGALLDRIPGVIVDFVSIDSRLMKTDPKNAQWEIKGMLYAQP